MIKKRISDKPSVKWDGCSPGHQNDVRTALEHICILPVRHMIERGDNSKDIAAYLRSQYKSVGGESKSEWNFTLWYDEGHLYIQYDDKILNNLGADSISLTWSQAAKELIKMMRASDEEAPNLKEEKTMAKNISSSFGVAEGFDFGSEGNVEELNIAQLMPYRNHRFALYEGDRLDDMVQSIKKNGVITPIIVRPLGGGRYEILAGHNRVNAAKLAGKNYVPAIVKTGLSDAEAELIVVDTNILQRGFADLKISEQAFAISVRYHELFDEQKVKDIEEELYFLENGKKPETETEESGDKHRISSLVLLHKTEIIDMRMAKAFREVCDSFADPSEEIFEQIITGEYFEEDKPKEKDIKISIPKAKYNSYFAKYSKQEAADILDKALEMYFNSLEEQEE